MLKIRTNIFLGSFLDIDVGFMRVLNFVHVHMFLTAWIPRLKANNFLNPLVHAFETNDDPTTMAKQMLKKLQLIARVHGEVVENVNQVQVKKK
jgi:hypothetical protein